MSDIQSPHVVIIGGGVTGLSTAYYIEQLAQASGQHVTYTLIERDSRYGGKLLSVDHEGFTVEAGPDSILAQKPWAIQLLKELDLESEIITPKPAAHPTYIFLDGKPIPMPAGMSLLVPTRLMPFLRSPILSWRGKLRMALDLLIPARRDKSDETMAQFVRRRLGQEALDRVAEPLLAGIHSAEPNHQSILSTFPRFRDMEAQYGSILRGSIVQAKARKAQQAATLTSPFKSLRGGVELLTKRLASKLTGNLQNGQSVTALDYQADQAQPYTVTLDNGDILHADAVIITTPAAIAANLVAGFRPALAASLRELRTASTGTISLAYRTGEVGSLLDGYGMVIPQKANRRINSLTIMSDKYEQRAPSGYTYLRVFVGGSRNPDVVHLADQELLSLVRDELRDIFGIQAAPLWSKIYRFINGSPQYDVGHTERIDALMERTTPGLYLAGAPYRGVGIPDCIRQGQLAAEAVHTLLQQKLATEPAQVVAV